MAESDTCPEQMHQGATFATTHWSVVLTASRTDTTKAHDALEQLCRTYWYPIYAHIRRRGFSPPDAEDLTQGFFLRLLKSKSIARADKSRGRFRSFLLGAVSHFLTDEWDKGQARKRGRGQPFFALDVATAESRLQLEAGHTETPDKAFDREWATTLLGLVLGRLEAEYRIENKAELFDCLKQTLTGTRESQPYALLATQLQMSEGALRVAVHRLRARFRELLQAEIANTVASPNDIKAEIRHLFKAIARA
jgi:DNA-directed RNA polymerase specialized sigma24 family protein